MSTMAPVAPDLDEDLELDYDEKPHIKLQPPYAVIVLNDDVHTFEYVIMCFQKVFGYNLEKSVTLATQIHYEGRAIVWSGSLEVAELKKEQIQGMGPDHFARVRCTYPLGVELEPLA